MLRRALGGLVVFVVVLLGAPRARAQVKGAPRLEFSAPPGCPNEATFRNDVAIFFGGQDPFNPTAPDVVRVTFTKIPGGYRGTVQYTPPKGDPWPAQSSTGAPCGLLFQSVARTASLRVPDPPPPGTPAPTPITPPPEAAPAEPPPSKPPDPVASKPPEVFVPPPKTPTKPPPAPKSPMDLTIALSASALMTAGFTADVGPAFQIGAEARYQDWFSLGLEVRGVLPSVVYAREKVDKTNPYTRPQSFDISQVTALLVPCFRFKTYFAACGVAQGGGLIDRESNDGGIQGTFAFGPRFAVEFPFAERFAVFAWGEALFVPDATFVGFRDPGPNGTPPAPNVLWRQSVVSSFFGAGLSVKFQ